MKQMDFFNPVSHRVDPPTSQEAADRHEQSGKRQSNVARVLTLVDNYPGRTATFLAARSSLTLTEVRRRLTDLLHRGVVYQGELDGREVTWWPV